VGIGTRLPELYASLRETGLDAANGRLVGGRTGAGGLRPQTIDAARSSGEGTQVLWTGAGPAVHREK